MSSTPSKEARDKLAPLREKMLRALRAVKRGDYSPEGAANAIGLELVQAFHRFQQEVEARTVERCAKVADKRAAMANQVTHEAAIALLQAMPDAIRQQGDTHNGR